MHRQVIDCLKEVTRLSHCENSISNNYIDGLLYGVVSDVQCKTNRVDHVENQYNTTEVRTMCRIQLTCNIASSSEPYHFYDKGSNMQYERESQ